MSRLKCGCPGSPAAPYRGQCPGDATQEDFLCDHCRTIRCEDRTADEMNDLAMCIRLGCPEHTVPGSKPLEVAPF